MLLDLLLLDGGDPHLILVVVVLGTETKDGTHFAAAVLRTLRLVMRLVLVVL